MIQVRVEIRSDHVIIEGYINAVERDSRPMPSPKGKFVEQVRSGVWKNAISKNDNIIFLLNHNNNKKLGTSKENLKLREDNIGLYAETRVYDPEVIKKAKENKLIGWSFGFKKIKDSWGKTDDGIDRRYLDEIELREVSILDDSRIPAYYGTSVETRENEEITTELRSFEDIVIEKIEEDTSKNEDEKRELKLKLLNLELEL
ncbi:HK97 family phage prohead protease [Clostridium botulinum]|nr:HK97 family phage prohead protease [Clostridium botulinum]EGT5616414.1 HK97 family phage prohead protease [Clostridium botulinum]EGT5623167.1 HK97 family phage prohead protease [Clostridium botulinum]EGT5626305.1 HK97 family phage prohead protease [Clostridium botulinum]EGT5628688.1 HK97 family phage prohead protease [Clostridium botulinum]